VRYSPAALAALVLAGCATPPRPAEPRPRLELAAVPFFPQADFECGPAALATVLAASGVAIDAAALAPEVYLPGRRGSLQAELAAAARRHGRLAYELPPEPDALYTEVGAGRPALVLQNFGTRRTPHWHYAVVIGFDPGHVLLRSGLTERQRLADSRFEATWSRAGRWALVALRPGELPAAADPRRYLEAASALEATAAAQDALLAFEAATRRWPSEPAAWLGVGNARERVGRRAEAEQAYRHVLAIAPGFAAARNNLANLLAVRGCTAAARAEIARAAADAAGTPLEPLVAASARELSLGSATADGAEPADCAAP
jgi:tetratricopeptide (TPR) repeat protein